MWGSGTGHHSKSKQDLDTVRSSKWIGAAKSMSAVQVQLKDGGPHLLQLRGAPGIVNACCTKVCASLPSCSPTDDISGSQFHNYSLIFRRQTCLRAMRLRSAHWTLNNDFVPHGAASSESSEWHAPGQPPLQATRLGRMPLSTAARDSKLREGGRQGSHWPASTSTVVGGGLPRQTSPLHVTTTSPK